MLAEVAQVAILAPIGRDAEIAGRLLRSADYGAIVCRDLAEVVECIDSTLCLIATEEALLHEDRTSLANWIENQPHWSDYPTIVLATRGRDIDERLGFLQHSSVVLERPFNASSLISAVHSAARSRRRQLQVKDHLEERERTDERQKLLIRELHHRVKNTLSNVQALLGATAKSHSDIDSFTRAFSSRIVSLAQTHSMLTEDYWQKVSLRRILMQELNHYDTSDGRYGLAGPEVELVSDVAVPLGMAIHELATNSAKYGALSVDDGRINVDWSIDTDRDEKRLLMCWQERGGPRVHPPSRKGFGSMLLERVLTVQCRATIDVKYPPDGFEMDLQLPLVNERLVPSY